MEGCSTDSSGVPEGIIKASHGAANERYSSTRRGAQGYSAEYSRERKRTTEGCSGYSWVSSRGLGERDALVYSVQIVKGALALGLFQILEPGGVSEGAVSTP
jgi:hypothetical protein